MQIFPFTSYEHDDNGKDPQKTRTCALVRRHFIFLKNERKHNWKLACKDASCVAARWSKISRIRAVRSQTLTSPPKVFSKLRSCLNI